MAQKKKNASTKARAVKKKPAAKKTDAKRVRAAKGNVVKKSATKTKPKPNAVAKVKPKSRAKHSSAPLEKASKKSASTATTHSKAKTRAKSAAVSPSRPKAKAAAKTTGTATSKSRAKAKAADTSSGVSTPRAKAKAADTSSGVSTPRAKAKTADTSAGASTSRAKAKSVAKTASADDSASEKQVSGSSRRQAGANLKFLVSVAQAVKDAVAPLAKAVKGRELVEEAPGGDVTFLLDRVAEKALFTHLTAAGLPIAYYSAHEGYSTFSSKPPKSLLLVDPIDGTRAAKSGFEGCVVAVASTRVIERPTIADVECACIMDLLSGRIFLAERGKGARVYVDGRLKRPKRSANADLETMIWSMTIPARPAELIFPTAARIIDLSSLKGGFFACNSTSFSLTRLVTNQLDACVDVANRYYRDIPDRVEDYFINAGRGKVVGVTPYDMAAALLIAEEAGCVVTDAYGNRFDDLLLLDSSTSNHQSIVAAANAQLHEKLLSFFDMRIKQYELLLTRHGSKG